MNVVVITFYQSLRRFAKDLLKEHGKKSLEQWRVPAQ